MACSFAPLLTHFDGLAKSFPDFLDGSSTASASIWSSVKFKVDSCIISVIYVDLNTLNAVSMAYIKENNFMMMLNAKCNEELL